MIVRFLRSLKRVNLLIEPTLRHYAVYARALYYVKVRRALRTLNSEDAVRANLTHNLKSLYGANNRMNLLLYPLSVIETLQPDAKILVIGPRNENDLFTLAGLGFKTANVIGLDLISYSPRVVLGDMHKIPFPDNFFDAVVCGWTLSYSTDPRRATGEMIRVARPGGLIAIGVEYSTMTPEDERSLVGYSIQEFEKTGKRVNSVSQILGLFGDGVDKVYFEHDAPRRRSHTAGGLIERVSNVAVIFSTAKNSPEGSSTPEFLLSEAEA